MEVTKTTCSNGPISLLLCTDQMKQNTFCLLLTLELTIPIPLLALSVAEQGEVLLGHNSFRVQRKVRLDGKRSYVDGVGDRIRSS